MSESDGKEKKSKHAQKTKPTPLPARQLTILCIVLLTESICSTMLIPFVGLYVSFMMKWPPEKAGYTAGSLVGLFMLGQVISGKQWGYASETFGRKFSIVIGVSCCAVSAFFFGFCSNIYLCAFWRLVHGIMAGCSLVAKTVIADVTDETNQSSGFALVSLTWGVGTLIGPTVGGLLYDPAHQGWLSFLNWKKDGFWANHPAFLPSMIVVLYNFAAIVVCILFLEETNRDAKPLSTMLPSKIEALLRPYLRYLQPKVIVEKDPLMKIKRATDVALADAEKSDSIRDAETNLKKEGATAAMALNKLANDFFHRTFSLALIGDSRPKDTDVTKSVAIHGGHEDFEGQQDELLIFSPEELDLPAKRKSFGFKQAFSYPLTRGVCIISMLISGSDMMFAEIFPLWAIAPAKNGGLNLSSAKVGILILVNSVPAVIANINYSRVFSRFHNPMVFWSICQFFYGSINLLFPFVTNLSPTAEFWCTMAIGLTRKAVESWTFATLMVIVARSAPDGYVSIMYGIQQSVSCIVRCIVPFTFAPLFAWTISEPHAYPFNHHFTFILSLIPLLVSAVLTIKLKLPKPNVGDKTNNDNTLIETSRQENADHAPGPSNHEREQTSQLAQPPPWASELHGNEANNLLANNSFVVLSSSFTNPMEFTLQRSAAVSIHANDENSNDSSSKSEVPACQDGFLHKREFFVAESMSEEGSMVVNHEARFDERLPVLDVSKKEENTSSGDISENTETMTTCIFPPTGNLGASHVVHDDRYEQADVELLKTK